MTPKQNQAPVFITTKQLATRWGVGTQFINRMRYAKEIPWYELGKRCVRFRFTDILEKEAEQNAAVAEQ
jgi:hypothetical protein